MNGQPCLTCWCQPWLPSVLERKKVTVNRKSSLQSFTNTTHKHPFRQIQHLDLTLSKVDRHQLRNVTTNFQQPLQPLHLRVFSGFFFTSFPSFPSFTSSLPSLLHCWDFWGLSAEAAEIHRKKNSFWRSQSWPILIFLINCDWRNLKSALLYVDASCPCCLFVKILTAVEKFEKSLKKKIENVKSWKSGKVRKIAKT